MASAIEQLAANLDFRTFGRAKELQQRILFLLGALLVYRFGTYLSVPGINAEFLKQAFFATNTESGGSALNLLNLFTGGAAGRGSIFALTVVPYISASIIVQLMTSVLPRFEHLKKEGERGRVKINQYTRYLTVVLATIQSFAIVKLLESNEGATSITGWFFTVSTVVSLVGGTMFLVWLGEQITARGIGNGVSVIIFAGIIAELPAGFSALFAEGRTSGAEISGIIGLILIALIYIIFMERAQRRLLIQYPRRQVGMKQTESGSSHLPIKINTAGVIPPIFASTLLLMPATVATLSLTNSAGDSDWTTIIAAYLGRGQPVYLIVFAVLVVFFTFFYTSVVFNPEDTADNLKKQGGFIAGYRPGQKTAEYIDYVLTRITTLGALYLLSIVLIPEVFASSASGVFFGGTSLLIIVNVSLDLITQVQGRLLTHQYENLIRKSSLRGGKKKR